MKMVITDLDGTLKEWNQEYAARDLKTLKELGRQGIIRAIATGRNLHFAKKALPPEFPIDYLIFSSGAGIIRWADQKPLFEASITKELTASLITSLQEQKLNFMIHDQIPREHYFYFKKNVDGPIDFEQRIKNFSHFARPLNDSVSHHFTASQGLVIISADEVLFARIAASLPAMKIIRTTSPYNARSIWVEIFPKDVSKGEAVRWLCHKLEIELDNTLGIGNDFNDLDLLETTGKSWVVAHAPEQLRARFNTCSEQQEGFSYAIRQEIGAS